MRLLAPEVGVFKVGLELFVSAGPEVVSPGAPGRGQGGVSGPEAARHPGHHAGRGPGSAAGLGVELITCHADQEDIFTGHGPGRGQAAGGDRAHQPGRDELMALGYPAELQPTRQALVLHRASPGPGKAGCAGVVCSGREAGGGARAAGAEGPWWCARASAWPAARRTTRSG